MNIKFLDSKFNLIEQAEELYKIKKEDNCFLGLLYPSERGVGSYNRPALSISGYIREDKDQGWVFFASIGSIDDAGLSFFYNYNTEDKAKKDMDNFIAWIESLFYKCPNYEEVQEFCKQNNCYADWW